MLSVNHPEVMTVELINPMSEGHLLEWLHIEQYEK
jgi:hypothetical protein